MTTMDGPVWMGGPVWMECPVCQEERVVEQPPCPDEHTVCPEWMCTDCGAALLVGWMQPETSSRRSADSAA